MNLEKSRRINNRLALLAVVVNLAFAFYLGFESGYGRARTEIKTYVGTVIDKEYLPEEIKENPVTKTIETHDKQYVVRVKDFTGNIVAMNVTKEEFNQIDIGEKLRR